MIPAIVPVPINKIETPITLLRPNSVIEIVSFALPVTNTHTSPPNGSAISGSMLIPQSGRRANKIITTSGPANAAMNPGKFVFSLVVSSSAIASLPFLERIVERTTVTMSAPIAGIMFSIMSAVKSTPNASLAAIVFGFGERIFPAFPPPIMARRILLFVRPTFLPIAIAIGALIVTVVLATMLSKKGKDVIAEEEATREKANLPGFMAAFAGPLVVIILLALRPLCGISIDPLIALPVGGLVCVLVTGNAKDTVSITEFGLSKVIGVSILLIGTGTIAGIIKASALQYDVITIIEAMNMPAFVLAPIAGILMGAASASTTAGTTIASQTFGGTLIAQGVPAISAGAMVHAGATVLDSLPHGSFFHATGGAVRMSINDRMKLIPYEALVGFTSTVLAIIWYLI